MAKWLAYLFVLIGISGGGVGCKATEFRRKSAASKEETGLFSYSILVRLHDNSTLLNDVVSRMRQSGDFDHIAVMGGSNFYNTWKEVYI